MPIDLVAGETRELNVELTPVVGPGNFSITRFIVFTKPAGDVGEWRMRCRVRNMGSAPGAGTLYVTGELRRFGGDPRFIVPINETHQFSLAAGATHEYRLEDWQFLSCPLMDQCWLQITTSWDESTRPLWFQAGYYELGGVASMAAADVQANTVALRLTSGGGEAYRWEFSIRTPPTGTAEQLIEDIIDNPLNDTWCSCYFYGKGLLSKRNYKAHGSAGGRYAETYFTTK